jgi:hypothetical protein
MKAVVHRSDFFVLGSCSGSLRRSEVQFQVREFRTSNPELRIEREYESRSKNEEA